VLKGETSAELAEELGVSYQTSALKKSAIRCYRIKSLV